MAGNAWYAATNEGLFVSVDHGRKWYGGIVEGESDFIAVSRFADGTLSLIAPKRGFFSHDEGKSWSEISLPAVCHRTLQSDSGFGRIVVVGNPRGRLALDRWRQDMGARPGGLPARNVFAVRYDPATQRLLATALGTHGVFESKDGGQSWQRTPEAGVSIKTALDYQGRLLAASSYNGLLLQLGGESTPSPETAHIGSASATTNRQ